MTDKETMEDALYLTIKDIDNVLAPVTSTDEAGSEIYQRFEEALKLIQKRLKVLYDTSRTGEALHIHGEELWNRIPTEDETLHDYSEREENEEEKTRRFVLEHDSHIIHSQKKEEDKA